MPRGRNNRQARKEKGKPVSNQGIEQRTDTDRGRPRGNSKPVTSDLGAHAGAHKASTIWIDTPMAMGTSLRGQLPARLMGEKIG
jgi:hypothetical protein